MPKIIKISYENWLKSAQKWVKITEKIKAKEPFDDKIFGYKNPKVFTPCGYCREMMTSKSIGFYICDNCFLYQKTVKSMSICFKYGRKITYFFRFCILMENQSPDFKKAQEYAEVMLKAILSDCPDKKQATKDRIVFSVEKVV